MNKHEFAGRMRECPTRGEGAAWTVIRRFQTEQRPVWPQRVLFGYIVDFLFPNERVIVEVDGLVHATPEARARDARRQANLEARGYRFVRVTNGEVLTDNRVLHRSLERLLGVSVALPMKKGERARLAKLSRPKKPKLDWFERRMAKLEK